MKERCSACGRCLSGTLIEENFTSENYPVFSGAAHYVDGIPPPPQGLWVKDRWQALPSRRRPPMGFASRVEQR